MLKRWLLRQADEVAVARLAEELNVRPLIAKLLAHRGIVEPDAARRYLSSSLRADLPSPFLMTGMEKAAERLAVLRRPSYEPDWPTLLAALPELPTRLDWIEHSEIDIAATDIRERVQAGLPIDDVVPVAVANYIAKHHLYDE